MANVVLSEIIMDRKPLLVVTSALLFSFAAIPALASFTQQGPKLVGTGAVGASNQGFSVAISGDGNTAIVGAFADSGDVGAAWIYTRTGNVWSQQGTKLVGTGAVGASSQGLVALSADGNTALVGGPGDNGGVGAAWVFTRSGGVWSQQGAKLVGTGAVGGAGQGFSVALSADGNTAVLGGSLDNNLMGAVWVFTRSGSVWSQQGMKLVGSGATGSNVQQGFSVDLSADGNTVIFGGPSDNNAAGAAWVLTRSGSTWTQQGPKLVGTGSVGFNVQQGRSVAISADGNTALVGGFRDNNDAGAAWAFTRSGGVWTQQGPKLVATGASGSPLVASVSLSADGNIAVVGGDQDNSDTGATWVFTRNAGVWNQLNGKLVGTGAAGSARQGFSGAISNDGNTIVVGGVADNSSVGAAWVFVNPRVANCRFASSVVSFSSQFSTVAFSAQQAIGPPNVYPDYADDPQAWASFDPDNQPEFIHLAFPDPERINFVNVYETYAPGAISAISVKNPYSGLLEVVWTATPAAAPPESRLYTATFPVTPFPVSEVRIDLASQLVFDWNEIDAVGIGYSDLTAASQWATGVVSFSSQFTPNFWSAQQALGPPDVYPAYGDDPRAWASLNPDDQREFLTLSFPPTAINFVNVVETFAPGALDTVWVKNPNSNAYEAVWSGTASPEPNLSRIRTVSFPETRFLVSDVRLAFNSPAVPDWNEVDAVGIGRCACQQSLVDVPTPVAPKVADAIEWARPNPFGLSTGIGFSLARAGHVRIDVFDVLGHRVARVLDRSLPSGRHDAHWDGCDAQGRAVAGGIYYLRIDSAELSGTRKVVKIE